MANLSDIKIKELTSTGAVTTDGVPGFLYYAIVSGTTAGQTVAIKDGATTKLTLIVPADKGNVVFEPPKGQEPKFTTDIDTTIGTGINATFIYREIT